MNSMNSVDELNLFLSGLITIIPVQRRRAKQENEAVFRDATYCYRVRVLRDNTATEERVCKSAFMSIYGVTRG